MSDKGYGAVLLWSNVLTGQVVEVVSFVLIASAAGPLKRVAARQLTGGLARICHFPAGQPCPTSRGSATLGFSPSLFNQNTWKGHSICFSPCTNLTDVTINSLFLCGSPGSPHPRVGHEAGCSGQWEHLDTGNTDSPQQARSNPSQPLFL